MTHISNELSGDAGAVVQSAVINGDVTVQHRCTTHLTVYLQAAEGLSSLVFVKEVAALAALAQLVRSHVDMTDSVIQLLSAWRFARAADFDCLSDNPSVETRVRSVGLFKVLVFCLRNSPQDPQGGTGATDQLTRGIVMLAGAHFRAFLPPSTR